jgi:hypothetical protein
MAGGKAHHIAVILPFLFLLFLFVFPPYAGHHYWWLKGGVTILLCASVFMQSTIFSLADFTEDQKRHLLAKNIAKQLDFILDECDQDRYLRIAVISIPDLLYMHHSPLPSGLIPVRDYENVLIPPFNKMLSNSLLDTNIVFSYKSLGVHPDVKRYLEDHFTKTPWPCAEGKLKFPIDLRLLFRKA